jgi:RNA polymerase sigma factor (sigma-70 family)
MGAMFPDRGFSDIVRDAQRGDRDAMDRLLAMLRPDLERLATGYADPGRAVESTEDLVQEAWVRAWQNLAQFRGSANDEETRAMFHAWVGQIVHRIGLNAKRAWNAPTRKPRDGVLMRLSTSAESTGLDPGGVDPTPSARLRADEDARRVREALAGIADDTDREIVRARFFDGISLREVARRAGMSYRVARRRFERAMRTLERELGREA